MTTAPWHAGPELLRRYAAGSLDDVGQAAVETHVSGCADCRDDARALVQPIELGRVWERVLGEVSAPPEPWPLRMLRRIGMRDADLVILRASANLVVTLAMATIASVCFAIVGGYLRTSQQELFYLALAPLLPAVLVAGAYDGTDPLRELADATPFSKLRVALLRTAVAVLGALPLVLMMGVVPGIGTSLAAWLLPSLALTSVTLALLTWWRAPLTVGVVAATWLTVVTALRAGGELAWVAAPAGQSVSVAVIVAAATVIVIRLGLLRPAGGVR
jgi:hypothetical protein